MKIQRKLAWLPLLIGVELFFLSNFVLASVKDQCEFIPRWEQSQSYEKGKHVRYSGKHFQAKWWSERETPGTTGKYGAWKEIEGCYLASSELSPLQDLPDLSADKDHKRWEYFEKVSENDRDIDIYRILPGVYALYEYWGEKPMKFERVISYLIIGTEKALLFDSGLGIGNMKQIVRSLTDLPIILVNSHYHYDHVGGNSDFATIVTSTNAYAEKGAKGLTPEQLKEFILEAYGGYITDIPDAYESKPYHITMKIEEGTKINLGSVELEVMFSPGHTPDSLVLIDREQKIMYTGDTFYKGSLFAHLKESDLEAYYHSVMKLKPLQDVVTKLFPTHSTPMVDSRYLTIMADAFQAIKDGTAPVVAEGKFLFYGPFENIMVIATVENSLVTKENSLVTKENSLVTKENSMMSKFH